MAIERDIHFLLFRHDCVIVPRFGGFLTHYRPARLDEARRVIHPPGKDLSFNRHLVRNDGLLADHVARQDGLAFDQANTRVEHVVEQWNRRLSDQGRLELQGIGTFYHDQERNLQFEPDKRSNFLREAYGLRPVGAVPVEVERPAVRVLPLPPPMATRAEGATRNTPLLWAAAIAGMLLFSVGAWYAYNTGMPEGPQWSGLGLPSGADRSYAPRTGSGLAVPEAPAAETDPEWPEPGQGISAVVIDPADGLALWVDAGSPIVVDAVPDKTAVEMPEVRARFHIIGGCFAMEENAERFVSGLRDQGFDARVIDQHKGLYRVAYGSYPDRGMALDALSAVRRDGTAQAWLLVK